MGTNSKGYEDFQNKKGRIEQVISRVLYPSGISPRQTMIIHLGPRLLEASSDLPESSDGPSGTALLFGLAPGGVYLASNVTIGAGELLPHPFTLTGANQGFPRRFAFCGTFLPVTGTGRYPAPCPVELGLSSPPYTAKRYLRSSDHLTYSILSPPNDTFLYLLPPDHDLWPHWPVYLLFDSVRGPHEK